MIFEIQLNHILESVPQSRMYNHFDTLLRYDDSYCCHDEEYRRWSLHLSNAPPPKLVIIETDQAWRGDRG
jgi:hypothetical protein